MLHTFTCKIQLAAYGMGRRMVYILKEEVLNNALHPVIKETGTVKLGDTLKI